MTPHTPASLRAFEAEIAAAFDAGEIGAPVHLSGNNEAQLIAYFAERFRPGDWVFSTWRSHYHALLAGVPPEKVKTACLAGRGITLAWPEYRFCTSAIVGGAVPIATGVAMGLARRIDPSDPRLNYAWLGDTPSRKPHVHCFVGDMASRSGIFHECREYAVGFDLPITFIVENNFKSVMTDTQEVWGSTTDEQVMRGAAVEHLPNGLRYAPALKTVYYEYRLDFPHSGAKQRTNF
jgi:TPP-dependent pyruvate/acetoin dehydrogenase alpha subunit